MRYGLLYLHVVRTKMQDIQSAELPRGKEDKPPKADTGSKKRPVAIELDGHVAAVESNRKGNGRMKRRGSKYKRKKQQPRRSKASSRRPTKQTPQPTTVNHGSGDSSSNSCNKIKGFDDSIQNTGERRLGR